MIHGHHHISRRGRGVAQDPHELAALEAWGRHGKSERNSHTRNVKAIAKPMSVPMSSQLAGILNPVLSFQFPVSSSKLKTHNSTLITGVSTAGAALSGRLPSANGCGD